MILLVNERHLSAEDAAALEQELAISEHCWLIRQKSAWNDAKMMFWLLGILRRCLEPLEPFVQICFLLDCAPCHAMSRVAQLAARNVIVLVS